MTRYKFVKYQNEDNRHDTDKIIIIAQTDSLPDLLQSFEGFLKGAGFQFDGHLEIVPENESMPEYDNEIESD